MADRSIAYSAAAKKMLRRIDAATSKRIRAKVKQLAADPDSLSNNVRRLVGEDNLWRLRVGDWRVIYTMDLVILSVTSVSPRGSAYD